MKLYKTGLDFLNECGIAVSKDYFSKRLQSHADYPAIHAFTDTLDELNITYKAVLADTEKISEIPFPFLAQNNKNGMTIIVRSVAHYEKNKTGALKNWNGVAILADKMQQPVHLHNTDHLKEEKSRNRFSILLVSTLALLAACVAATSGDAYTIALTLLSLAGAAVGALIMIQKFGTTNTITKKLCGVDIQQCDKVIRSRYAEISRHIDVSDIVLAYFLFQSMFVVLATIQRSPYTLSILLFPGAIALVSVLSSIYYQSKVIKAWCRLCLVTALVIVLQTVVLAGFVVNGKFSAEFLTVYGWSIPFAWAVVFGMGAWVVKSLFRLRRDNTNIEVALLRWKRSPAIFKSMLKEKTFTETSIPQNPFVFGSPDAALQITMVSGVSCKPCATAHKKLNSLYQKYAGQLAFSLIFALKNTDTQTNEKAAIVEMLLDAAADHSHAHEPIEAWYDSMDIEKWKHKHQSLHKHPATKAMLENYAAWSVRNNVDQTPTFYINGLRMPNVYEIDDIESFIVEINEGMLRKNKKEQVIA